MENIKDLTGQRFGKLVVIHPTDERRGRSVVWECKCDCGNTAFVPTNNLRSGNTASCGCAKLGKSLVDLTGQRFGKLVVIRRTEERQHGSAVWECKCDCGNTKFVNTNNLRNGNTKSCGCSRKGKGLVDLTGQRFGQLVVVRQTDERRSGAVVWECKCDCGNTKFVPANNLRSGNTTSCGCAVILDIAGQRFGKLVAVRPTEERQQASIVWECKCDCGNTRFVSVNQLRSGHVKSCGCGRRIDITGQRFGRLIAVRPTDKRYRTNIIWECKCDCGNTTYVAAAHLRSGTTASCGCLRADHAREAGKKKLEKHLSV